MSIHTILFSVVHRIFNNTNSDTHLANSNSKPGGANFHLSQ
jgi:hypothetical protein